jgi:hypothetical protein
MTISDQQKQAEALRHIEDARAVIGEPGATSLRPTGIRAFFAGVALAVAGGYLVLNDVEATSSWGFFGLSSRSGFGPTMLPLLIGIGVLSFDAKSRVGWFLSIASALTIVAAVLTTVSVSWEPTRLFNMLAMFGVLAGGVGLVLRSLRRHPQPWIPRHNCAGRRTRPDGDMPHIRLFRPVVLVAVCAACGGGPYANGKAFLLGQNDHSGIRISLLRGGEVVSTAQTDASGAYRIRGPDGAHDLRFEHEGYQPVVQPDVVVQGNDVSVEDVTLRRGALIDSQPMLSAQPLGKSKMLVQFDRGLDSPSEIVDLASGSRLRVAGGSVDVLDANDQFATVRIDRLYRLDLATAALSPVQPPEETPGGSAGGYYFYAHSDGKLSALATGSVQAVSFDLQNCGGPVGTVQAAKLENAPGWIQVTCNFTSRSLVNPSLPAASSQILMSPIFVDNGSAYYLTGLQSGSSSILRKLDLTAGTERRIKDNVFASPGLSRDGDFLFVASDQASFGSLSPATYSFLDMRTGVVRDAATNARIVAELFDDHFVDIGWLVSSASGSTVIRFDTHSGTPLCSNQTAAVVLRDPPSFRARAAGVLCVAGPTVVAYDWDSDRARTLTANAAPGVSLSGQVAIWNEGQTTHVARIGAADRPITACATQPMSSVATSGDGFIAALPCPDADGTGRVIAVDLRTGISHTVLAAAAGSRATISLAQLAVSSGGRGVALTYSTSAPAGDPVNCGAAGCAWFFDRQTNSGAGRNDLGTLFTVISSKDDRAFLVNRPVVGNSIIARFGTAAPTFGLASQAGNQMLAMGSDGRFALLSSGGVSRPRIYFIADLVGGGTTPVGGAFGPDEPLRVGSSNDFAVDFGVAHLDTGVVERLGVPFCEIFAGSTLAFLDFTETVLQRYEPGTGVRTLATNVEQLPASCADRTLLIGDTPDGGRTVLLRLSFPDGVLTPLAGDMASNVAGSSSGGHAFMFQHPDSISGDLLLLDRDFGTVLPLHARAHLRQTFVEGGHRIAFAAGSDAEDPMLAVANLDGSGARTVGPGASRVSFSADGNHLWFEARGLVWAEDPAGPGVALDESGKMANLVVSARGDSLLYSVSSGDRRGTYRVDLRTTSGVTTPPDALPWVVTFSGDAERPRD